MPKALLFGMKHHLVEFCQVCSNQTAGQKNDLAPGVTFCIGLQNYGNETARHRALIFGMLCFVCLI